MATIVLLATAWGSKYGGINVVNLELTRALAEVLGSTGRVLCVVPHAEGKEVEDARGAGVTLVPLGLAREKLPDFFDAGWVGTAEKALEAQGVKTADWCMGHDAISGEAANLLKKNGSARGSAIISHMSYADYQGVKHESFADAEKKSEEQREILKGADVVLAVGPLLRDRASDMVDHEVTMIVPGLSNIATRPPRKQLVALSFGRFEAKNDRIKQIRLVGEGLAEACKRAREPGRPAMLHDNPQLKLIGVSKDETEAAELRKIMKERAGKIINLRPLPYQEDRQKLFEEIAGANLAFMLSWHEGFGLTGWEAIAAELPLIVSKQSGLYKFLKENGLHRLVHGLDVDGGFGDDETPNFSDDDRTRVANTILEIVADLPAAQLIAKNLKSQLKAQGWTWQRAARTVLDAFGITPPAPLGSDGEATGDPKIGSVAASESAAKTIAADRILETKELVWSDPLDPPDTVLLRAEYQVVPFHKLREPELEKLIAWAELPEPAVSFRLHIGGGGSGKTRLAIELCRKMRAKGWQEGFLRERTDEGRLAEIIGKAEPLLVVVDYAETRRSDLYNLARVALSMPKGQRLRVLMLARNAGDWWDRLPDSAPEPKVADVLRSPRYTIGPYRLPKLELDHDQRAAVFREALGAYAERFHKDPATVPPPPLVAEHFAEPLFVHLAALCALRGDHLEAARDLLDATLAHERAYWKRAATGAGIPEDHIDGIEQVAALATLAGGTRGATEARGIVAAAPRLRGLTPAEQDRVFDLLRRLYPLQGGIDAIYPDLVGEWVVLRALDDTGVLDAALHPGTPEAWARSAFSVLNRLAQRERKAEAYLLGALEGDRLERYASLAMDVALEAGDPLPRALSEMLTKAPLSVGLKLVTELREKVPRKTVALQELAVTIAEIWASTRRHVVGNRKKQTEFVEAHSELASSLSEAGQTQRALKLKKQCVEWWRALAEPLQLAGALHNLSVDLGRSGLHEQALHHAREAEAALGSLAQLHPACVNAVWATALSTLAIRLGKMGLHREAIEKLTRAEGIWWQITARSESESDKSDWARAVLNLAIAESRTGMAEEALHHSQKATLVLAELATTQPDAHSPDWAISLTNLSAYQKGVGEFKDAQKSANKAEKILRKLAEARPDAYRPSWAAALVNVASAHVALGEHGEALRNITHAKSLCGELAARDLRAHGADFALALRWLSISQSHWGQHDDAIVSACEAEAIQQELVHDRPEVDQSAWPGALSNLAEQLNQAGQHVEAIEHARRAEEIYRKLAVSQPDLPKDHLASSCLVLAEALLSVRENAEALRFAQEGFSIINELFTRYPRAYTLIRGVAQTVVAEALAAEGRWNDAEEAAEAAMKQLESFPTHPDAIQHTIRSLDTLASALDHLGERDSARQEAERALEMVQRERKARPMALSTLLQRVTRTLDPSLVRADFRDLSRRRDRRLDRRAGHLCGVELADGSSAPFGPEGGWASAQTALKDDASTSRGTADPNQTFFVPARASAH